MARSDSGLGNTYRVTGIAFLVLGLGLMFVAILVHPGALWHLLLYSGFVLFAASVAGSMAARIAKKR